MNQDKIKLLINFPVLRFDDSDISDSDVEDEPEDLEADSTEDKPEDNSEKKDETLPPSEQGN